MDLSPRAVIAGRYRVDTKVGAGGMGEVWLGEHIAVGVRVAVKTLLPAAAMNHEVVARFKREAYILGKIRSDHVARVVDFVADDLYGLVLVMEFVEGDPLSRMLLERTLTVEEGVELAFGLASALKDLHGASIIHRDLKPGNVMMQPLPEGRRRAVVVDFGVSRLMSDKSKDEDEEITGITRADMAVGTIEYMAPEQILNSRNVTPGSDIYAAGAMLFRACGGRHVFGNITSDTELAQKKLTTEAPALPLQRMDKLAEGFSKLVARMVKRRPSERYKTADEVLQDLLPLRALARDGSDLDSTTVGRAAPYVSQPQAAPVPAQAPAPPVAAYTQPMPPSGRIGGDPNTPSAPQPAPTPVADSSGSVSALQAATRPAPAASRRGVPVVVTFALVGAALGGGMALGPRLLGVMGLAPTSAAVAPSSAAPPDTSTRSAPSATAASSAAPPPPSATAAAADASVAAVVATDAGADAAAATTAIDGGRGLAADGGASPAATGLIVPRPLPAPLPTSAPLPAPTPKPASTDGSQN